MAKGSMAAMGAAGDIGRCGSSGATGDIGRDMMAAEEQATQTGVAADAAEEQLQACSIGRGGSRGAGS